MDCSETEAKSGENVEATKRALRVWKKIVMTIHQIMMYTFAELQQMKTLSSAATQNVPLEVFTFPAYKLSVCLRHGIVRTVNLCQNSF